MWSVPVQVQSIDIYLPQRGLSNGKTIEVVSEKFSKAWAVSEKISKAWARMIMV